MNERTKTGLEILQTAVLLGVLGDVLLRAKPWGLNVLLFIGALVGAMTLLILRRRREFWNKPRIALNAALIFFALMFVWRDSIELKVFDAFAILTILSILTLPALQIKTQLAGIFHYFAGFLWSGISAALTPFLLVFYDVEWDTVKQSGWTKHLLAVLRGLMIAAPLVFIFGALFVAADAVFEGIVERTFKIVPETLISHLALTGFLTWITAGYLRGAIIDHFSRAKKADETFAGIKENIKPPQALSVTDIKDEESSPVDTPKPEEKPTEEKKNWQWQTIDNTFLPRAFTLGAIETSIILGLLNLLFLSFVVIQVPYLFGGMNLVQSTPDFKLAEYARRGFGELVVVAALVLPILLFSHWLLRKDQPANEKIYRVLAGIQIALLFVIMLSAAQRLLLLTGNLGYGLTTTRFYPMAFMVWLALVFIWFTLTVLRNSREQFAWGSLWLAIFVLGALHIFNPDEYILRTNVRLMREGRTFDAHYNVVELSDDAIPALLETMPQMSFDEQCGIKWSLERRVKNANADNQDFRSWNFSRWRARNALQSENLNRENCPSYTNNYFYNPG